MIDAIHMQQLALNHATIPLQQNGWTRALAALQEKKKFRPINL
jgi:hypothetical protein